MTGYFAYGSNMAASVIGAEGLRPRVLGRARLPGHRLAFTRRSVRTGTGVADLVPDDRGTAWGVLYSLAAEDLAVLDRKEGAGWAYERTLLEVITDDGARHHAVAYTVIDRSAQPITPSPDYLRGLIEAGRERGLPEDYLAAVERAARAGA